MKILVDYIIAAVIYRYTEWIMSVDSLYRYAEWVISIVSIYRYAEWVISVAFIYRSFDWIIIAAAIYRYMYIVSVHSLYIYVSSVLCPFSDTQSVLFCVAVIYRSIKWPIIAAVIYRCVARIIGVVSIMQHLRSARHLALLRFSVHFFCLLTVLTHLSQFSIRFFLFRCTPPAPAPALALALAHQPFSPAHSCEQTSIMQSNNSSWRQSTEAFTTPTIAANAFCPHPATGPPGHRATGPPGHRATPTMLCSALLCCCCPSVGKLCLCASFICATPNLGLLLRFFAWPLAWR